MVNGTTCQPLLSAQPCDWGSNPELLGQQVQAIQQGGFESDIPYVCAVGILGASHATDQMSSLCGGPTRAGTWQPNPGGTVELPCPPGYFCPVGTVNPLPCVAGTWSNASNLAHGCPSVDPGHFSSAGSTRQRPCNPGSVAPVGGLSECQACPPGSHQRSTGATQCAICPANSYCPEGTSHPLSCESGAGIPNAVTLEAGSSGSGDCRCKKGYYDDESLPGQIHCTICPSGVDCSESAGTTVSTLPIKVGYYRISRSSVDVRRCPDAATNCSDSPECVQSTSGCGGTAEARSNLSAATASRRRLRDNGAGSSNATDGCHEGLTGVFCRLCAPRDDTRSVYYTAATTSAIAHCTDCRESVRDSILVFFGYLALAAIVGLLLYCTYIACLSTSRKQQLDHAWQKFTPHNKLKILIGFYMITTKVGEVYEVEMPPEVRQVLSVLAIGVSFGVNGVSSILECLDMRGYVPTLTLYMITPLVLALLILFVATGRMLCTPHGSATALLETAVPPLLKLAFVAYPLVTNLAFDAFSCYEFTESEWLKADVAIRCHTSEHHDATALAWTAIIVYPIGLLLLNGWLLFAARRPILTGRPTLLSRSIAFLYREYEPQFFWWELVEMLRRFVLVGLMVLAQGSMLQLVMGTLLSAIFLLFQVQASPYSEMADDYLASASNFGLVAVFLCSFAFKVETLVGLEDIASKMSIEQESYYSVNQSLLILIMFASVVGALVLSFVLFIVQITIETRRVRREARASKARRLRYKSDSQEVHPPELPTSSCKKHFHTFLSHVWGTGQDQMRIVKQRLVEMIPDLVVFLDVDDLKEIGDLEGYIDRTSTVLVYCSKGYFTSKNCMRELVASTVKQKPIIALIDPDASRGGLSLVEVQAQLTEADALYEKWGFNTEAGALHGKALKDHLFAHEPIEWNRIGHFQDVTMREISERLLSADDAGATYVDREIVNQKLRPLPPPDGSFHVYCSLFNPGAKSLMVEVSRKCGFDVELEGQRLGEQPLNRSPASNVNKLCLTMQDSQMAMCDHMLLYLTSETWTRGEESAKLGEEIGKAMDLSVDVLLAHEMPGVGGQEKRFGCEFGSFFSCPDGATPSELLQRGIYSSIAVPLKGGPWRDASMALMAGALGMSEDDKQTAKEGGDPLGLEGVGFQQHVEHASKLANASLRTMQRTTPAHLGRIINITGRAPIMDAGPSSKKSKPTASSSYAVSMTSATTSSLEP